MAQEVRSLPGIRGIAASWVVLYHVHEADNFFSPLKMLLTHGYLAVDVFFVLSGFVMALSYGHFAVQGWTATNYGSFLLRRFARIYPLYLVMTCIIGLSIFAGLSKALPLHNWLCVSYEPCSGAGLGIERQHRRLCVVDQHGSGGLFAVPCPCVYCAGVPLAGGCGGIGMLSRSGDFFTICSQSTGV
jgi:hypothetical protein